MKHKKKSKDKLFVVKKYIFAPNARTAILRERKTQVDDIWVDDDWRKNNTDRLADAIGFVTSPPQESNE